MNSNPQARGEKVVNNRGVMTSLGHRQYRCDVMHMLTTASVLLLISLDVKRSMSDAFIIAPWTVPYKRAVASGSQVWVNPRRQSRPALQLRQEAPCDGVPRRRRRIQESSLRASLGDGVGGVEDSGPGGDLGEDVDMSTAPVDMEQGMGSFAPSWAGNNTEQQRPDAREHLIRGSVIASNQTEFPYPTESFPPLINSEVYYNGTSNRYWWNQDASTVCIYVPVNRGFDSADVDFVAKTWHVSLKLEGEEILTGTPFYGIDGFESLFVVDQENDPPFVQLELYKLREYQNWEDLLLEGSTFIPGGRR